MEQNVSIRIPDISSTLQIRGFHIGVVGPGWSYHNHHHPSFELLYCWDGHVTEWLNEKPVSLDTGNWLLIPPGMKHKTLNPADVPFTYLSLLFDIDDPDFRRELKLISNSLVTKEEAELTDLSSHMQVLDSLIYNYQIKSINNDQLKMLSIIERLELQARVLLIIKDILYTLNKKPVSSNSDEITNTYELDLAFQIEERILTSLYNPGISIQQIAKELGIGRNQCTRLFSKIHGMSPRQYITSQRLLKAKELLVQTTQSIEGIAYDLGFSSLSHFSRQFKRWTGVSPFKYRPSHVIRHPEK